MTIYIQERAKGEIKMSESYLKLSAKALDWNAAALTLVGESKIPMPGKNIKTGAAYDYTPAIKNIGEALKKYNGGVESPDEAVSTLIEYAVGDHFFGGNDELIRINLRIVALAQSEIDKIINSQCNEPAPAPAPVVVAPPPAAEPKVVEDPAKSAKAAKAAKAPKAAKTVRPAKPVRAVEPVRVEVPSSEPRVSRCSTGDIMTGGMSGKTPSTYDCKKVDGRVIWTEKK